MDVYRYLELETCMRKSLILTLLIFFISCRTSDDNAPLYSPGMQTPVCTGIYITDVQAQVIGIYGRPNGYSGSASRIFDKTTSINDIGPGDPMPLSTVLNIPYPNPANGTFTIDYSLSKATHVSLWVVPADFQYENHNTGNFNQGNLYSPEGASVKVLFRSKAQSAGSYRVNWNCRDDYHNKTVPAGFYRIFLETDDGLFWEDVYIWWKIQDVPQGLRKYLNY